MFLWTNLICSLLKRKKTSLITDTLTSLVVSSWKWQGGFQWVSQLPGQRTHSSPVLTSGISPPCNFITILLGNCIPGSPTTPSVLSEACFPEPASVSHPHGRLILLSPLRSPLPLLYLLPRLAPLSFPLHLYPFNHSHGVLVTFKHFLALKDQRRTRPTLGGYYLPFSGGSECNSHSETTCTLFSSV